jgi:holo-[acyl-carrier protein] synthase
VVLRASGFEAWQKVSARVNTDFKEWPHVGSIGQRRCRVARPMVRVGIDLLEIERLEHALARRPGLEGRLFTDGERRYAAGRARPAMHLAARFCAKEAVAKALALESWSWHDVEVLGGGEPPRVRLSGRAEERARELAVEIEVSLTHTRVTAGAVAVAA